MLRNDQGFNGMADAALRAGIVIHTLDILGTINDSTVQKISEDSRGNIVTEVDLMDAETRSFDDKNGRAFDPMFGSTSGQILGQSRARRQNRPLPLSEKTGGLFLTGNNFFLNGIGAAEEEMKEYYLLSYIPPGNTIQTASQATDHKIKIKCKRSGAKVHTRDGFYNVSGTLSSPDQEGNPLLRARYSPSGEIAAITHQTCGLALRESGTDIEKFGTDYKLSNEWDVSDSCFQYTASRLPRKIDLWL
jgi:hypothetical protein